MSVRFKSVSVALTLAALCVSGQAASLEGQRFEDTAVVAGAQVRLNGLGLRGVAWIKAFVAALYVAQPSADPRRLIEQPGAKRLSLKVMLKAPAHELTKSLLGRIQDHEPVALQQRLQADLADMGQRIDGLADLQPGDVITLDFLPGLGTQLLYNGRAVGKPLGQPDLYAAMLRIFIGEHPIDKRMKAGLLGSGA